MKVFSRSHWFHLLLMLVWLTIGTGLRFSHLTTKPFWTDEFSTLVFSLGNSFRTVPLDQVITADVLLRPLKPDSQAGVGAVIYHLSSESNHPPVYFVLTHLWLQLFSLENATDLAWAGRSLSAFLGTASIPAMFGLGWFAFRSRLVGQIAAAMMAVSPYGIYLAQEARHYTLAVLFVIASLCCLIVATRAIQDRRPLPVWVGLTWVGVNCLGIASHYFFALTLCAEALVLIAQACQQGQQGAWFYWRRIWAVAVGTLCGGLVWLPVWQKTYGSELTQWIYRSDRLGVAWLEPVYQTLAWVVTMLALLPVQASNQGVVIVSGVSLLIFIFWALPILWRGLRTQQAQQPDRLATQVLGGFTLGAIAVFFGFTYGLNTDLTSASRYSFVYFPAVIALVGASLAICWNAPPGTHSATASQPRMLRLLRIGGKKAVVLIWLVGLISGLTVVWDLGYQKTHRPELVVQTIQEVSQAPVLIAIAHKTHGQTGRMMGLAWEFNRRNSGRETLSPADSLKGGFRRDRPGAPARWPYQFLLAHQDQDPQTAINVLQQALGELPRPLDLWLVNFPVWVEPSPDCAVQAGRGQVDGYDFQLYHCQGH